MNSYPIRSIARLSVIFGNVSGAAADPTTVTLTIVQPDSTKDIEVNGIVRDGVGLYRFDYEVTMPGIHKYKWQGDGSLIAANRYQQFRGVV